MNEQPEPISRAEERARMRRVAAIAGQFDFNGTAEYCHVYSRSGGAQYGIGPSPEDDIMVVYAEAFERDADPQDFRLEALIAPECGQGFLGRTRFFLDERESVVENALEFKISRKSLARQFGSAVRVKHNAHTDDSNVFVYASDGPK